MGLLLLVFGITLADQLTKQIVRDSFALNETLPILDGFFNLTYVRNTGAAWGMLGGQNTALTVLSIAMLIFLVVFRKAFLSEGRAHLIAFGLMVGGILGNLLDRIRLGWVTDFLDFHWHGHHWPVFNIADASICTGVGLYIIFSLRAKPHEPAPSTE